MAGPQPARFAVGATLRLSLAPGRTGARANSAPGFPWGDPTFKRSALHDRTGRKVAARTAPSAMRKPRLIGRGKPRIPRLDTAPLSISSGSFPGSGTVSQEKSLRDRGLPP